MVDLALFAKWNETGKPPRQRLGTFKNGITQAVTALERIQLRLAGQVSRIPHDTVIFNIIKSASHVGRNAVVSEPRDSSDFCIGIKTISSCSI